MSDSPLIWALLDDRPGHQTQVCGVAQALHLPYETHSLPFNRLASLPNGLLGASTRGLSEPLPQPLPDLVIAAGRKTIPVMRAIKRLSPATFTCQLMWPGDYPEFDLIAVPEHDNKAESPRIVSTLGAPHALTEVLLQRASQKKLFAELPTPYIGVLLGDPGTQADAKDFAAQLERVAGDGSLLITSSRRTNPDWLSTFSAALTAPHFLYAWGDSRANPYHAILAQADALIVSGDSMSMLSEAAFTGNPLFIYSPPGCAGTKHSQLHQQFYSQQIAQPFSDDIHLQWKPAKQLNESKKIAEILRKHLPLG